MVPSHHRRFDKLESHGVENPCLGTQPSPRDAALPEADGKRELRALPADDVRLLPQFDNALAGGSLIALVLVGLVLALAAVNVSHLVLARSLGRRHELATRRALGAGRADLLRLLAAEGTVLALAGGTVGLALALPLLRGLDLLKIPLPVDVTLAPRLDFGTVLFTLGLSLFLGVGPRSARDLTHLI